MNECLRQCVHEARKHGMIWFGAAISLAEIEAGLHCGGHPLAVFLGHLLGGILLYFAGLMGTRLRKNGMECTQETFGVYGMRFFAIANILQLVGWTAVMIAQGANAVEELLPTVAYWKIVLILGLLVTFWLFIGLRHFSWFATITMSMLLVLIILLSARVLMAYIPETSEAVTTSFWEVFELSLAMPLSWLPLISDYTKDARAPRSVCASSAIVYTIGSLWMYFLGMGFAALHAESIAQGILSTNIGRMGLLVVLISTVTTTYLDAYSAGESAKALRHTISPQIMAAAVCILGVLLAMAGIMERYTDFLYLISSLFAPMAVALLTDQFLIRHHHATRNFIAFLAGFAVYHGEQWLQFSGIGPSLAGITVTFVVELCLSGWKRKVQP